MLATVHPWIATAFSFLFYGALYIPTGQVFGSNTSAQIFEPIAYACTKLAQHIFENEDCDALIIKYQSLIDKVIFSPDDGDPNSFVRAKPCSIHQGINKPDGSLMPQPFIMFVDDNLMVDTRYRMQKCMTVSLEALFRTMSFDKPEIHCSNVSID